MTIETSDDYHAAVERLQLLGSRLDDDDAQDEYFALTAAMVDYETRRHRTQTQQAGLS